MQKIPLYIVEPDRTVVDGIISLARSLNLTPIYFAVPGHALKQIEKDCQDKAQPFLVIVQADMPLMSGAAFLAALAAGAAAKVPYRTMLLAGETSFGLLRNAVQMGVNDILPAKADARTLRQAFQVNRQILEAYCERQLQVNEMLHSLRHQVVTPDAALDKPAVMPVPAAADSDGAILLQVLERPAKRPMNAAPLDRHDQLAVIRALQYMRRARDRAIAVCADGDPSFDILLFVYEQALLGNRVSVTAACHASTIPQTTAMRKVDELVAAELLVREPDPADRRRINLAPTEMGNGQVATYLLDALSQLRALFGVSHTEGAANPLHEAAE